MEDGLNVIGCCDGLIVVLEKTLGAIVGAVVGVKVGSLGVNEGDMVGSVGDIDGFDTGLASTVTVTGENKGKEGVLADMRTFAPFTYKELAERPISNAVVREIASTLLAPSSIIIFSTSFFI